MRILRRDMMTITKCRVCKNSDLIPIISLGNQRLSGVFPSPDEPQPSRSPLELIRCNNTNDKSACGLVQLRHSANLDEMYGSNYGYNSSLSPTMGIHLEEIAERTINFAEPNSGDVVLDIGCNDGTLLNYYSGLELIRIGIDPSSEKFISNFQDDIKVKFDFFTESNIREMIGDRTIKIITSIAMFYDIEDPISFMSQIKSLLSEDGIWALELSYLPLLLENLTYDQICHEHVTYLAIKDMNFMMKEVGLKVLDVDLNSVNGGSFFIIASHEKSPYKPKKNKIKRLLKKEDKLSEEATYNRFNNRLISHKEEIRHFLDLIKKSGKTIYGYGASTKGNIVLNYCDLTREDLPAISDRNQKKYGLVTPGTGIPIISHEEIRKIKPDYLFVLIWHFRKEVIEFELEFLERGGKLVFHLPRLHIVDKHNYNRYLNSSFEEQAYPL